MRLDVGAGKAKAPGHIGIDIMPDSDIVWDLNDGLPMDFVGSSKGLVEGIRCHQVVEHLDSIIPLMNDCYEVMKEGAQMEISTPLAGTTQFWQDPTHKKGFVPESFDYFSINSPFKKEQDEYGITARFKILGATVDDGWNLNVLLQK